MILAQRHDTRVADRIVPSRERVDGDRRAGVAIEERQSAAHRADPDFVVRRVGE